MPISLSSSEVLAKLGNTQKLMGELNSALGNEQKINELKMNLRRRIAGAVGNGIKVGEVSEEDVNSVLDIVHNMLRAMNE